MAKIKYEFVPYLLEPQRLGKTGSVLYSNVLRPDWDVNDNFSLPLDAPCEMALGGIRRTFGKYVSIPITIVIRDGD